MKWQNRHAKGAMKLCFGMLDGNKSAKTCSLCAFGVGMEPLNPK